MNSLARKRRAPVRLPYQLIWGFRCSRLTAFHSLLETASSIFISLLIHLFSLVITIRHYSSLFATICHCSSLFATICHCSSLFATIRSIRSLFGFYHWPTTADWFQSQLSFPVPAFHVGFFIYSLSSLLQAIGFVFKKKKVHIQYIGVVVFMKHGKMDYRSFVDLKDRRCQRATDLSLPSLVD